MRCSSIALVLSVAFACGPAHAQQPTQGPPSEVLANALRMYQQHRYAEALRLFDRVPTGARIYAQTRQWAARTRATIGPH